MSIIVVGGGVVGLSIAYGLLKEGQDVTVLDGADDDYRSSRGNFGLIWIQGKGAKAPHYATWSRHSSALWGDLAKDLLNETGIDVAYNNIGGIDYFTDEAKLAERVDTLNTLRDSLDEDYPFDVLDRQALKLRVPEIGNKVVGGIFSPMDGDVNPLYLLRALSIAVRQSGGTIRTGVKVVDIDARDRDFTAVLQDGRRVQGERIVLAAGLGAIEFGDKLGFKVPIRPQQGQILITEKLPFFLRYPSGTLRQVNEGGVLIGATQAELGLNDDEDVSTTAELAQYAIDVFPRLGKVNLVRSWAHYASCRLMGFRFINAPRR